MANPNPKQSKKPRYVVMFDGQPTALQHITGLYKSGGILLPGKPFTFRRRPRAHRAIERTLKASRAVRTSLVSEFVRERCPDLESLFKEDAKYTVKETVK